MYTRDNRGKQPALRIIFNLIGIFVVALIVECESGNSTGALDGLRNVVTLTADNFDSKLATKYNFVLFYRSG